MLVIGLPCIPKSTKLNGPVQLSGLSQAFQKPKGTVYHSWEVISLYLSTLLFTSVMKNSALLLITAALTMDWLRSKLQGSEEGFLTVKAR